MRLGVLAGLGIWGVAAAAYGQAGLGAHVHGHSVLNVALEGSVVWVELRAPGADVVGFEHEPRDGVEQAALAGALARLAEPGAVVRFSEAAGCELGEVAFEGSVEDGHDDDGHGEHHVIYEFECAEPGAIGAIEVTFLANFENAGEVDVNVVTARGQAVFEADRGQPVIDVGGLFR